MAMAPGWYWDHLIERDGIERLVEGLKHESSLYGERYAVKYRDAIGPSTLCERYRRKFVVCV